MKDRAARRYALAAFEAAQTANAVSVVESELKMASDLLEGDTRLKAFFISPENSRDEKMKAIDSAFSTAHPVTRGLLHVMLDKGREALLHEIVSEYSDLRRFDEKSLRATITSAYELSETEKQQIESKLASSLGQKIEPDYSVDPLLVGGVRVVYGGFVLDGSVKGRLNRLRESLRVQPQTIS